MTALIPRTYGNKTCVGNWFEDRYLPPVDRDVGEAKSRPVEEALACTRLKRLAPRDTSYVVANSGERVDQSVYKQDFVELLRAKQASQVPVGAGRPLMITHKTLHEALQDRTDPSDTGFRSSVPRFEKGHDAREFETTNQRAFGPRMRTAERTIPADTPAGCSTGGYTVRGSAPPDGKRGGSPPAMND